MPKLTYWKPFKLTPIGAYVVKFSNSVNKTDRVVYKPLLIIKKTFIEIRVAYISKINYMQDKGLN